MSSCRKDEGGAPLCKLGRLNCRRVESRGHSLECLLRGGYVCHCRAQKPYKLMVVVDYPRYEEDRSGIPFSAYGNKEVLDLLGKAKADPNEVYLTYQVKCPAPYGRGPSREERTTCAEHMSTELAWVQPKAIVVVGNEALKAFNLDGKGGLTKIRGQVFEKPLCIEKDSTVHKVIPTLNPSVFIHNPDPKLRPAVLKDFIRAWEVARGLTPDQSKPDIQFTTTDSIEAVKALGEKLLKAEKFCFDTETVNLEWWKNPVICFSFALAEDDLYVLPFYRHDPEGLDYKLRPVWTAEERVEVLSILKRAMENPASTKIAHNAAFDYNVYRKHVGVEIKGKLMDTMILHWLLSEIPPHDLEYLADLEFATGDYSKEIRDITGQGADLIKTYDWIPDAILYPYTAKDVSYCYRLADVYLSRMSPALMNLYWEEKEPMIRSLAEGNWNGHHIGREKTKALKKDYVEEMNDLLLKCKADSGNPEFNPSSPDQVKNAMILLGYEEEIRDDTKVSGYSTNKITLSEMSVPLAANILRFRTLKKWTSTYLDNILNNLDSSDRARFSWKIHGTKTGRLSAKVLHQIPRIEEERIRQGKLTIRDIFDVRPGHKYVYTDASQVELRVMAVLAKEQKMLDMFASGEDVHEATAKAAIEASLGMELTTVSKHNRAAIGKAINFGVIYGSEGYQISQKQLLEHPVTGKMTPISETQVRQFMKAFREKYSNIAEFMLNVPAIARYNKGVITTPFGQHRRMFGELTSRSKAIRHHAEREAVNFIIQGTAGAMTNRSQALIHAVLDRFQLRDKIMFVNTVHDSLAYEVQDDYVEWFLDICRKVCERPYTELDGYSFPWERSIGGTWAECEMS